MKGKLETTRNVLQAHHKHHSESSEFFVKMPDGEFVEIDVADGYCDSSLYESTNESLALIDTIIAELDSPELVERVSKSMADKIGNGMAEKYTTHAKAAIEAIKD